LGRRNASLEARPNTVALRSFQVPHELLLGREGKPGELLVPVQGRSISSDAQGGAPSSGMGERQAPARLDVDAPAFPRESHSPERAAGLFANLLSSWPWVLLALWASGAVVSACRQARRVLKCYHRMRRSRAAPLSLARRVRQLGVAMGVPEPGTLVIPGIS